MRAIAIIAVVVYHLDAAWLPGGFLGVDLFFVISGFLITKLLLDHAWSGRAGVARRMGDFYARRARRILPATVLLVGVLIVVAVTTAGLVRIGAADTFAALGFATNWWQAIEGRDYFAAWTPSSLQHLWSLAIEEQFYLLWPALLVLLVRGSRPRQRRAYRLVGILASLGAIASAAWMWHLADAGDIPYMAGASRLYYGTDTHASGILVGAAAAAFIRLRPSHRTAAGRPSRWVRVPVDLLGLVAVAGLVVMGLRVSEIDPLLYRGGFLVASLLGVVAVLAASRPWSLLGRALDRQPLRWIGRISFELYLWHWPVGLAWHAVQPEPGAWWFVAQVALMVALAGATHHAVTVPIWHPRPGAATRPRVSALAAIAAAAVAVCVAMPSALAGPATPVVVPAAAPVVVVPTTSPPAPPVGSTSRQLGPAALSWPISAFGDSVMNGGTDALRAVMPNITVLATGFAQAPLIYSRIREAHANGTLGPIVVIHHGHNGRVRAEDLAQLLAELSDRTLVILLTVKLPYPAQQAANNDAMRVAAQGHRNVVVADWLALGTGHRDWFSADGTHLHHPGAEAYAQLIATTITQFEVPSQDPR